MNFDKKILVICGPTAVGKSDFTLELGAVLPIEIINMDVGQFYFPLSIGTAKPEWRSLEIPHHFFDIITTPKSVTVVEYRKKIIELCAAIHKRNKLPVLVGGSLFYLKSLLFPLSSFENDITYVQKKEETPLWDQLHVVDPKRAEMIHKNDSYRLERALAIWHSSAIKPSAFSDHYDPPGEFFMLFLTRERKQLYQRINSRVDQMIVSGWLQEVESLKNTEWEPFLKKKRLIGYSELLEYLDSDKSEKALNTVVEQIKKKTRNYAKRQHTFWRMLEKQLGAVDKAEALQSHIFYADLTIHDRALYINQLLRELGNIKNNPVNLVAS